MEGTRYFMIVAASAMLALGGAFLHASEVSKGRDSAAFVMGSTLLFVGCAIVTLLADRG